MAEMVSKAAVLRIIFESVGKPATAIYQKVRELPPAEAVEVVRCSECRKGKWDPWAGAIWCEGRNRRPEFYCYDGERKSGGQDDGQA